jgi:hypothetical protein
MTSSLEIARNGQVIVVMHDFDLAESGLPEGMRLV